MQPIATSTHTCMFFFFLLFFCVCMLISMRMTRFLFFCIFFRKMWIWKTKVFCLKFSICFLYLWLIHQKQNRKIKRFFCEKYASNVFVTVNAVNLENTQLKKESVNMKQVLFDCFCVFVLLSFRYFFLSFFVFFCSFTLLFGKNSLVSRNTIVTK